MSDKPTRRNPFKVGTWICMFGKVTALHGNRAVVVRVGPSEITMLTAEVWNPETAPRKPKKS